MIGPSTLLLACAAGLLVGFQDPDDGLPPLGLPAARPHTLVPGGTAVVDTVNASVGGLPAGSNVEVLTWDRAYALALIRARSAPAKGTKGVAALDRAWLDRESQRLDIRDFARFRGEFLASPPAFRDPAPALLELARRHRAADDAARNLNIHERYAARFKELVEGRSRVKSWHWVDRLDESLTAARDDFTLKRQRYRDGLDAVKVELGLSPEALVLPDASITAAFGTAFEAAERWKADPIRQLTQLDAIILGLPAFEDVAIDGRTILSEARRGTGAVEDLLRAAVRVALANRAGHAAAEGDDELALRVRRGVRHLEDAYIAYALAQRRMALLYRRLERVDESFTAPPDEVLVVKDPDVTMLVEVRAQIVETEDRLVALWTTYQAQRLALLRDLGTMPADDWTSFVTPLIARPGDAARR